MSVRTSTWMLSRIDSERNPRDGQRLRLSEPGVKHHPGTGKVVSVSRNERQAWKRQLRKAERRWERECERVADSILCASGSPELAGKRPRSRSGVEAWAAEAAAADKRAAIMAKAKERREREEREVAAALRAMAGIPAEDIIRESQLEPLAPKEVL